MMDVLRSVLTVFGSSEVCSCVETSLFGRICSDGTGKEIFMLLAIAINIMTIGVGILAAIGIATFGIQWLTSSGDPAKLTKAKSRLFNVVLGLIVYVLLYAVLEFLLPGGVLNPESLAGTVNCTPTTSDDDPGGGSGGNPDDDPSPSPSPSPSTYNPLCGPESPGPVGTAGAVQDKKPADGSTVNDSATVTTKYTTRAGRVYYVFRQANDQWGNELINCGRNGQSAPMSSCGCLRTSLATILRSFGATNITPLYFAADSWYQDSKDVANSLSLKYIAKWDSGAAVNGNYNAAANKVWNALNQGGAAIVQVNRDSATTSSIFFSSTSTSKQHNFPIVDYRTVNNVRQIYIADTRKGERWQRWIDLQKMIDDRTMSYVMTFIPKNHIDCTP